MKSLICKVLAVIALASAVAGCNGMIKQESAMQWMDRQVSDSD